MRTIIALLCAVSCAAVLVGGCSTPSSGPDIPVGPEFRDRESPENVLYNLELAYEEMDLEEYLDCLSEDFEFFPCQDDVNDPEELQVNLYGGLTFLATAPSEFRMRIDIDQPNPVPDPEDVLWWETYHWFDLGGEGRGAVAGREEDATWGRIKYCFLESLSEPSRRTSPAEVIDQLEASYVAMDTVSYLDCLSGDFIFYPCEDDVNDPELDIPPEWYKPDERTMHGNMFSEETNVESISLTLTTTEVVHDTGANPEDPLDDTYVHTEDVDLRVNLYAPLTYHATVPSEFHLRVDPDEEGPYGETMWEVYLWYDLGGEGRGAVSGRVEDATWGSIKAMYW
jgi:hypothetical protein